jgi:DNA primase
MAIDAKLDLLKEIFGSYYKSGNEYLFKCKNPECRGKQKLSINLDKNVFKCWICDLKGNNIKRLIRRYGTFLQKQEWNNISGEVDLSVSLESFFKPEKVEESPEIVKLPKEFVSLANKNLPLSSLDARRYLANRGITKEDILKWKIGYCKDGDYANRIIIPSFNKEGNINYFVARTYVDAWDTYNNPKVSKDLIFNELYVDWKNDLTLVEGAFDAIKAGNAIPLLGSSLRDDSKLFQEILRHDTPIYIALDPDAEKKAFKLIKDFLSYDIELYKIDVSGFKDVGEMTTQMFEKRKKQATLINQETYMEAYFNHF